MGILGLFVDDSQCGGSLFFSYCRFNAFKSANFIFTILGSNWYHYQCRWDGLMDWKWFEDYGIHQKASAKGSDISNTIWIELQSNILRI